MSVSPEYLRRFPYFQDLDTQELKEIASRIRQRSYEKNEVVFLEEDDCFGLCLLKSGRVKIFKSSPEGKEQVLRIMEAGDSFNEVPIFDGGPNPASVETLEPTLLYILSKEDMLEITRKYPALAVLRVFSSRLRQLTFLVADLSFRHVTSRLAKILLDLAEPVPPGGEGFKLKHPVTQQELAAMAGTVREMIGRSLRALEEKGAIQMRGHRILVKDVRALKEMI